MAIYTHDTLIETLQAVVETSDNRVPLDHDSADQIKMIGTLLKLKQMDEDDTLDEQQLDRDRKNKIAFLYYYFKITINALIKNKKILSDLEKVIFDATIQSAFQSLNRIEDAKDVDKELTGKKETNQILDAMKGITEWYNKKFGEDPVTLAEDMLKENSTVKTPARAGTV